MKITVKDAKAEEGQPEEILMHAQDAHHAVASDPERYSIVKVHPVPVARSIEERVGILETRLDALAPDEDEEAQPE